MPSWTATPPPSEQREEPEVEIADEAWGEQTSGPSDTSWSGDDDRSSDFSDQHGQTLQEQLIEQLELAKLSAIDMAIARVITDAITDDGYLKDDLEDIRLSLMPEIEATTQDVAPSSTSAIPSSPWLQPEDCVSLVFFAMVALLKPAADWRPFHSHDCRQGPLTYDLARRFRSTAEAFVRRICGAGGGT